MSQDLAQWSETRSAGILDGISNKIEGANAELERRAAAAAAATEVGQSAAQAAAEQQVQAAALAKIEAINSRLAQVCVLPLSRPCGFGVAAALSVSAENFVPAASTLAPTLQQRKTSFQPGLGLW